ncbi:MAG: class I SAM-dependent methyltransferase [Gloeocapsa sp. UFS-A4-WI-NPMV-4B04]|jgi:SAM-dependent MidA family methyltransferase|nr:class I SAM-dependent methyltransferase [Gloeocapsa sp. UFS-A4-WI-NPMV-4B04]
MPQLDDDSNPLLCDAIARDIACSQGQRITFTQYMEAALYHPQQGYYATKAINIGQQGDFLTSPHLGADFGELLAEQFVQMGEIIGQQQFTIVEMGAGQGILAADILGYLLQHYPDFFAALEYIIVEKSNALQQEQQQRLKNLPIKWCSLEEIATDSIIGCCFSNELVDALPVHQFIIEAGQLREIYVTTQEARGLPIFVEVIGELSTPQLAEYFDLVKIALPSSAYPDGYRSEVNLAALDWLKVVSNRLQRGYLLTIDYGYPAHRYYNPMRSQGTLQCYYRHMHHNNPYINIGQQDITAHVDFTALQRWGEMCGLDNLGFTQQGLFLMALGLGDRIAALSTSNPQSIQQLLQRREALHQLIEPTGLGGFGVLIQSKNLTATETASSLKGLK